MKRLAYAAPLGLLLLCASTAAAQETARVQVNIKISAKTPSFTAQRLVISLSHNFPLQDDRGDRTVDRHIDAKFSHQKGQATVLTVTLGEKVKLDRSVQYMVTVAFFDAASKITHIGEVDREPGPFVAITNGAPRKLTILVRPAP